MLQIREYCKQGWVVIGRLKGTACIKIREIDPSRVKETSFTCSFTVKNNGEIYRAPP